MLTAERPGVEDEPRLSVEEGPATRVVAAGAWTRDTADVAEALVRELKLDAGSGNATLDVEAISHFDTLGSVILARLQRRIERSGRHVQMVGLDPRWGPLIDDVQASRQRTVIPKKPVPRVIRMLQAVGEFVLESRRDSVAALSTLGDVILGIGRILTGQVSFRFYALVSQMSAIGVKAVPIIALITFLIGAIVAQQGIFHFRSFGADIFVVDMVSVLVLRELGVVIVSIMVAGRTGSAYTAELGSMKMREEIDALKVMGLSPVDVLVVPRILAMILSLPLLTFLGSMTALGGGLIVAWLYGGIEPDVFLTRMRESISINHFWIGLSKAPFMALGIALIACVEGMRVEGSAESLGKHTTDSVVKSIFLVIVLDGLFAMFFAAIGI